MLVLHYQRSLNEASADLLIQQQLETGGMMTRREECMGKKTDKRSWNKARMGKNNDSNEQGRNPITFFKNKKVQESVFYKKRVSLWIFLVSFLTSDEWEHCFYNRCSRNGKCSIILGLTQSRKRIACSGSHLPSCHETCSEWKTGFKLFTVTRTSWKLEKPGLVVTYCHTTHVSTLLLMKQMLCIDGKAYASH